MTKIEQYVRLAVPYSSLGPGAEGSWAARVEVAAIPFGCGGGVMDMKEGVTDENACADCGGAGEMEDWSTVGCSDPSCCSPAMMWCSRCNGDGIDPRHKA